MRLILITIATWAALSAPAALGNCPALLDHEIRKLRSDQSLNLCEAYRGKPLLIVNTASHCGYTSQFRGLESLYQQFKQDGLAVAGFPSDSFRQEAGDEEKIATICYVNYGVTFDMFTEVEVKGDRAHPLFVQLGAAAGAPRWNFNKYLIGRDGQVVKRWDSSTKPDDPELLRAIEQALATQ